MKGRPTEDATIHNLLQLPEQILIQCLQFVGPHAYRYVGGTCREFQATYTTTTTHLQYPKKTNFAHIFSSKSCYQLFIDECLQQQHQNNNSNNKEAPSLPDRLFTPSNNNNRPILIRAHTEEAARHGSLECLRFICEQSQSNHTTHVCDPTCATRYGQDLCGPTCSIADFAAGGGHLDCLKYAHQERYCRLPLAWFAVRGGNVNCLIYIQEHGGELVSTKSRGDTVGLAARLGQLKCLRYLHEQGANIATPGSMILAASHGHSACVEFIHQHAGGDLSWECAFVSANRAAQYGNIDHLKYLMGLQDEILLTHDDWTSCAQTAERYGQTKCLEYLQSNGIHADPDQSSSPMIVHVKSLAGKIGVFHVQPFDLVEDLKKKIFKKTERPVGRQRLIHNGKQLPDSSKTLKCCGIQSGDTVHLTICM
eukprot:CAMPEP_0194215608 /NCGR_PEP_ID=MMETSP0156-20130528/17542_1 /TAXON_ID=33649 /ORGANISM="Thalassionema nitzschioides, Strain L26-B" /LENGTH=422 /DNA_ID=CAMNT_0038944171 /DNA_START=29 /DNA_END=1297 /DNA_ORIENTATION=-